MNLINENYMLTRETITNYMLKSASVNPTNCQKNDQKNDQKNCQKNDQKNCQKNELKDSLFWTIYKIVKDTDTSTLYESSNLFVLEKEFKIKCIEELRKIKPKLKVHK